MTRQWQTKLKMSLAATVLLVGGLAGGASAREQWVYTNDGQHAFPVQPYQNQNGRHDKQGVYNSSSPYNNPDHYNGRGYYETNQGYYNNGRGYYNPNVNDPRYRGDWNRNNRGDWNRNNRGDWNRNNRGDWNRNNQGYFPRNGQIPGRGVQIGPVHVGY